MKSRYYLPFCLVLASVSISQGAISLSGPSTVGWLSLGANYDFLDDLQTGDPASDIVGSANSPGFFTDFDDGGAISQTDGSLAFRVRLDAAGGNAGNPQFGRNLWVGIDANGNGSVDVYIGLNQQGSASRLGIFGPGTDTNTSPSTTSIDSNPTSFAPLTVSNYHYRPVNFTTDGGSTNDLTPGSAGDTDHYISFLVPFADVAAFLNTKSIVINDVSPLRYVLATSTQAQSFNQDLGGVNGGQRSDSTWVELGGFSPTINATGQIVPECSTAVMALLGSALALGSRRRRRLTDC